jgi:hypothetical protein
MTVFRRRGYQRTSKHGHQYWVSGTTVARDDWSRRSSYYTPPPPPHDGFLARYPEFRNVYRNSASFVNSNARCPVCGEIVYYYQNEHGSRVFFDELGPPWPKHPCTDSGSVAITFTKLDIRSQAALAEIVQWQKERGIDRVAEFKAKYGSSPWPLATIVMRRKSGKLVFLVLNQIGEGRRKILYTSCKSLPRCCVEGFVVAIRKQTISFFDTAVMTPKEVGIKRYRGPLAFFGAMSEREACEV